MARHTDVVPAIVRELDVEKDGPIRVPSMGQAPDKILGQPADAVTHSRGFGDSGYRVQTVKHDCPDCGFDRMIRRIDISPELQNEVRYWCLNPNCKHYASDELSHACSGSYPQRRATEPAVSD